MYKSTDISIPVKVDKLLHLCPFSTVSLLVSCFCFSLFLSFPPPLPTPPHPDPPTSDLRPPPSDSRVVVVVVVVTTLSREILTLCKSGGMERESTAYNVLICHSTLSSDILTTSGSTKFTELGHLAISRQTNVS